MRGTSASVEGHEVTEQKSNEMRSKRLSASMERHSGIHESIPMSRAFGSILKWTRPVSFSNAVYTSLRSDRTKNQNHFFTESFPQPS